MSEYAFESLEAEAAVLGCVIVEHERLPVVREILPDSSWFMRPRNAKIYDAILNVADRSGGAVDLVLLNQQLEDAGDLILVGGLDRLVSLANEFPNASHAVHYARLVRSKNLTYKAMLTADDLRRRLEDRADEWRAHIQRAVDDLTGILNIA